MMRRTVCSAIGVALIILGSALTAWAEVDGEFDDDGTYVDGLTSADVQGLARTYYKSAAKPPFYDYTTTTPCYNVSPQNRGNGESCSPMQNCPPATGPRMNIWRTLVNPAGKPIDDAGTEITPARWQMVGDSCYANLAPGVRSLSMAEILAAFHDTDFAKAGLNIQPEGDVTLVGLPTYFEVVWPRVGFRPEQVDQIDPARMLGYRVDVRPTLKQVTYVYGDRTSSRTDSLGGPYPRGDVVHEYPTRGDYAVRADVTYGGQYRINGGVWLDIAGDVTIEGTPVTLRVRTATNRLVRD